MPDITDFTDPVVAAIYEQYEKRGNAENARPYLGASAIGGECKRALWYSFRWAGKEAFDGRMLRLFQTGHLAEPRFIDDLRSIGATVWDCDPATGKQFGASHFGGHMRGHCDGVAKGIPGGGTKPHLLEFKTHSAKSFADLKKKGVQSAKPTHFVQCQWYMGKMNLSRALYLAVNKDTDELYSERFEFDQVEFEKILAKGESIIFAAEPPSKISNDPKFYLCNWCSHNAVCHGNRTPALSCRTCVHATPERDGDGRWSCAKHGPEIPVPAQRTGCGNHLPLPFLITYAEAIDAGDGWIMFQRKDAPAQQFIVTAEATVLPADLPLHQFIYASKEISAAKDHRAICDPDIEKFRIEFGGMISG
ncbi:MAG: hypothetical protein RR326_01005 [Stenotrophomonas sp.]